MTAWNPATIRALREARKETQQDFATALGVTTPTVSRWECAHSEPSKHTARLLDALAAKGASA